MKPRRRDAIQRVLLQMTLFITAVLGSPSANAADVRIDGSEGEAGADAVVAAGLEEVLVTAQERPERLKDIPAAAQVVSSEALAAANVADLSDLNNLVPSVQLN